MTVSKHVILLKGGLAVSLLALAAFVLLAPALFPVYPDMVGKAAVRSGWIAGGSLSLGPLATAPDAVFAGTGLAVLFAFASNALLFYFFEKTQSVEVRFLSIFLFSFAFELMRLGVPVREVFALPGRAPAVAARLLMFGRFFGLFALFAAGLNAIGLKTQKEEQLVAAIAVAALLFAFRMPIDVFNYDTSLRPLAGFAATFRAADAALGLLAVACFVLGAYTRGVREYYAVSASLLAAVAGRALLLHADNWLIIPGFLLLCAAAWFAGRQFRRMYLWT
jgi:hypothetical protein